MIWIGSGLVYCACMVWVDSTIVVYKKPMNMFYAVYLLCARKEVNVASYYSMLWDWFAQPFWTKWRDPPGPVALYLYHILEVLHSSSTTIAFIISLAFPFEKPRGASL